MSVNDLGMPRTYQALHHGWSHVLAQHSRELTPYRPEEESGSERPSTLVKVTQLKVIKEFECMFHKGRKDAGLVQ